MRGDKNMAHPAGFSTQGTQWHLFQGNMTQAGLANELAFVKTLIKENEELKAGCQRNVLRGASIDYPMGESLSSKIVNCVRRALVGGLASGLVIAGCRYFAGDAMIEEVKQEIFLSAAVAGILSGMTSNSAGSAVAQGIFIGGLSAWMRPDRSDEEEPFVCPANMTCVNTTEYESHMKEIQGLKQGNTELWQQNENMIGQYENLQAMNEHFREVLKQREDWIDPSECAASRYDVQVKLAQNGWRQLASGQIVVAEYDHVSRENLKSECDRFYHWVDTSTPPNDAESIGGIFSCMLVPMSDRRASCTLEVVAPFIADSDSAVDGSGVQLIT